jgi:hypothetical protein
MKKWQVLGLIIAVLCFAGCEDDPGIYDVTFRNNCDWLIRINLTGDMNPPQVYHTVRTGESFTYTRRPRGKYYVHIEAEKKEDNGQALDIISSKTYSIIWNEDEKKYYIEYR